MLQKFISTAQDRLKPIRPELPQNSLNLNPARYEGNYGELFREDINNALNIFGVQPEAFIPDGMLINQEEVIKVAISFLKEYDVGLEFTQDPENLVLLLGACRAAMESTPDGIKLVYSQAKSVTTLIKILAFPLDGTQSDSDKVINQTELQNQLEQEEIHRGKSSLGNKLRRFTGFNRNYTPKLPENTLAETTGSKSVDQIIKMLQEVDAICDHETSKAIYEKYFSESSPERRLMLERLGLPLDTQTPNVQIISTPLPPEELYRKYGFTGRRIAVINPSTKEQQIIIILPQGQESLINHIIEHEMNHVWALGLEKGFQGLMYKGPTEAITEEHTLNPRAYEDQRKVHTELIKKHPEMEQLLNLAYIGNKEARYDLLRILIKNYGLEMLNAYARMSDGSSWDTIHSFHPDVNNSYKDKDKKKLIQYAGTMMHTPKDFFYDPKDILWSIWTREPLNAYMRRMPNPPQMKNPNQQSENQ